MKIALLGDIGLLGSYSLCNNPNILDNLKPIGDYLLNFDLVVGNLETPFSNNKKIWGAKSSYICTDPRNIELLQALHIDAVSIANNHMYDFGKEGFNTTIEILDKAGIKWFGANGMDYRISSDNNRIVFNGFCCYSTNPQNLSKSFGCIGINRFNLLEVTEIIQRNVADGWLNIIAVHSGIEHVNRPSIDQIKATRKLANISPYVWYGHHPHVIQGIDLYNGSVIAHSVGNFCFAGSQADKNRPNIELSSNNRRGMILELEVIDNEVVNVISTLIHIGNDGNIKLIEDIDHCLPVFSAYIQEGVSHPDDYNASRIAQRREYLNRRKAMRNLLWLIKRLKPRYVRLLIENKINQYQYLKNVKRYI